MSRFHRKSAYYGRNDSFSRSYNAECAEAEGRLPRTRAAAALGVSVKAFDAGCAEADYHSTEWHHVGKYANMVDYFNTRTLADSPEFWRGAAAAYASKSKRAELMAKFDERMAATKAERIAEFAAKLARQRDCSRQVPRHNNNNWAKIVLKIAEQIGGDQPERMALDVNPGDFDGTRAAVFSGIEIYQQKKFIEAQNAEIRRQEFIYNQAKNEWLDQAARDIPAVVPPLAPDGNPWRGEHKFLSIETVQILATATGKFFARKMADARRVAAENGFNAVVQANPTGHKFGNGWIPAMIL